MKYEIWKLPPSHPNKFIPYDHIKHTVKIVDYVMVYSGEIKGDKLNNRMLEQLFEKFNINHPEDYHSESMSVSDLICGIDEWNHREWFYVDGIGFRRTDV